jgi:hypothetical protein
MKAAAAIVLLLAIVSSVVVEVSADCCKRKGDFGCCGNGPCNIFCCNCDNSCNDQCENTHCDTGEWFECAGIVSACAAACVVTEGEACADCMGPLYDTCKKCYSSSSSSGNTCDGNGREAWFRELADSSVKCISFQAFEAYAKDRIEHVAYEFTKLDANSDGCIDFTEFGPR